mgnify:CR=1 FL=1
MTKINKNMKLGEIVEKYPEAIDVFFKYSLHCAGCYAAGFESIEEGARAHGITGKKFDELMKELNKIAKGE